MPEFNSDDWEVCSDNTKELVGIYNGFIVVDCCDANEYVLNYYPLLDNIVAWLASEYGS